MAVIILLFTFGTVVAMSLPIATALVIVATGLALIGLLGHVTEISSIAPTLGTMIGLGVGIDYSLFIVKRYIERLDEGVEPSEAIARSVATSGSAVVFAGGTVVIALCSLLFAGIPLVTALGLSAALVVLVAVLAAITFLPALLAVVGAADPLAASFRSAAPRTTTADPHGWARWAHGVANHPWVAGIAAVADPRRALAARCSTCGSARRTSASCPTSTTARQSYDALRKGFGDGANGPFLVAAKLDPPAHNDQKKLDKLNDQIAQQQQQAEDAVNEQAQQLIAEGVPPDEAQEQAEAAAATAQRRRPAADRTAEEVPEVDRVRPAPDRPREGHLQGARDRLGLAGEGEQGRHRRRVQRHAGERAIGVLDPGRRARAARHGDPGVDEGGGGHRVRRRHDRGLHRPRRPDLRQARLGHRDRGRLSASSC